MAVVLVTSLAAACLSNQREAPIASDPTPPPTWTPTPKPTATPTPARTDLDIAIYLPSEQFKSLDPLRLPPDDLGSQLLVDAIYSRLLSLDPYTGQVKPGVVAGWQITSEGRIHLQIPETIRWHDGQPVTAEEIADIIRQILDKASSSPYGIGLADVTRVTAISPTQITIETTAPVCPTLTALSRIPAARVNGDSIPSTMGMGPFKLKEQTDDQLVLESLTDERPIRQWRVRLMDSSSFTATLPAADMVILPAGKAIDPPDGWALYSWSSPEYVGVFFNVQRPGLQSRDVRTALALSLDRQRINELVFGGTATPLGSTWLPGQWGIDIRPPSFTPGEARARLDAAGLIDSDGDGWRDLGGAPWLVRIKTNGESETRRKLAYLVAASYRAIGVQAEVEIIPYFSLIDALFRHDYDAAIFGWPIDLDPDQTRFWHSSQVQPRQGFNLTGWQDAETDRLLQAALDAEGCAPEIRRDLYQKLAARLAEQRPVDPLFALPQAMLSRSNLKGVALTPFSGAFPSAIDWHW